MKKIIELYKKYKEIINYLIFGVLTTVVNIIVYTICFQVFKIPVLVTNIIAWIVSVIFAYITNKIYVFESKTTKKTEILREIISFAGCRILSLILEELILLIFIEWLHMNEFIIKIIAQIVVIVLNYVFSKLIIFKNKKGN